MTCREEQKVAYAILNRALRRKTLVRKPCERCRSEKRVAAHHADYSKPLEVSWLCPSCHMREHALIRSRASAAHRAEWLDSVSYDKIAGFECEDHRSAFCPKCDCFTMSYPDVIRCSNCDNAGHKWCPKCGRFVLLAFADPEHCHACGEKLGVGGRKVAA